MRRKYRTGSRWALWRWTDVDNEFITRLHIVKAPWFAICLHWIHKPDPEPYLHDHPVSFLSIILRGEYSERRYRQTGSHQWFDGFSVRRRWFNWIKASRDDRHSITQVAPGGALTLCFMGPKTQEWGYHTPDGWVYWRDYNAKKRAQRAALDELIRLTEEYGGYDTEKGTT